MTTVKDMMSRAARACSLAAPSAWVANNTATFAELKDFLKYTVDEILERVDMPDPFTKDVVITGTGAEAYDLPADFLRLTRDDGSVYETTMTRRNGVPVTTNAEWTHLKSLGSGGGCRYYRLSGDEDAGFQIGFYRSLEAGSSVTVSYVARNWLRSDDTAGNVWLADEDVLMLPEEVVRLGVVWRFRQKKGLPFADFNADYEIKLARMINDRRGLKIINMGERPRPANPMYVPVPDYIVR